MGGVGLMYKIIDTQNLSYSRIFNKLIKNNKIVSQTEQYERKHLYGWLLLSWSD